MLITFVFFQHSPRKHLQRLASAALSLVDQLLSSTVGNFRSHAEKVGAMAAARSAKQALEAAWEKPKKLAIFDLGKLQL